MTVDREKVEALLQEPLDRSKVKPPPKGKYGEFLPAFDAIDAANRIFGNLGWSYRVEGVAEKVCEKKEARQRNGDVVYQHYVTCRSACTVTVGEVTRTDIGHGHGVSRDMGAACESAEKEAATDALKRALRTFGYPLGLALYDKDKGHVADAEQWREHREGEAIEANAKQVRAEDYARGVAEKIGKLGCPDVVRAYFEECAPLARAILYPTARTIIDECLARHGLAILQERSGMSLRNISPDLNQNQREEGSD